MLTVVGVVALTKGTEPSARCADKSWREVLEAPARRAPPSGMKDRSSIRLVHSENDIKRWMSEAPSVDYARPASCPCCGRPSREPGRGLGLHGHGLRARQVRGPVERWGRPKTVIIAARRYRCQRCSAVIVVVPRGIVRRRLFSSAAMAWALWLFGVEYLSAARVREAVSPWRSAGATAAAGWAQLRRWVRDVALGRLFGGLPSAASRGVRAVAERVTTALRGMAPPSAWDTSPAEQLWQGALHAEAIIAE